MHTTNLNAEDAFGLTLHRTTKTIDGREWAVYSDGAYNHVVALAHWLDSGFADVPDDEERDAKRFAAWNASSDQWADDLTAREAAHNAGLFTVHSADGSCASLECDTHGLCRAIAEAHSGERYDSPEFTADSERAFWDGVWPVIDGDGDLTGAISEGGDDMLSVGNDALIDADDARAAGWRIDIEEGTADPSEPVTVEFATADETIRDRGGIDEFAGLEHPAMPEACAAYREAATSRLGDDERANRLRAEAPRDRRILHSQWCGAHWGYSSGAIGTMARDLTTDERAAIDAAHEAGLAAAREVIEAEDAAAPRLMDYRTGEDIRAATAEEIDASADAGPEGVILLAAEGSILQADDAGADEARRVYVQTND